MNNKIKEKIDAFKNKLEEANIIYEIKEPLREGISQRIIFEISAGREKHECIISCRLIEINLGLQSNFQDYNFIQDYEAIWSKKSNVIEAEISSQLNSADSFKRKLLKYLSKKEESFDDEDHDNLEDIILPNVRGLEISIGYCSKEFSFLTGCRERGILKFNNKK